jgi:hypothetical protein
MVFGREPPKKCRFTSGRNCLIRLAAFVKDKAMGDDQSLKLRWIQFMWLSFAVHTNQPGPTIKHAKHISTRKCDGLLKSQVSREMDWHGQACHLATSFT